MTLEARSRIQYGIAYAALCRAQRAGGLTEAELCAVDKRIRTAFEQPPIVPEEGG